MQRPQEQAHSMTHQQLEAILHLNGCQQRTAGYNDAIDKKDLDDFTGFSCTVSVKDKPTEFLIYIKDFQWTIENQGTLIHEIVHTIIKIWDSNNIPHTSDTQEFLATSVSNLYEDITRKLLIKK